MSDSEGSIIPDSGQIHHPHHMGDDSAAAATEPCFYSLPFPTPNAASSDAGTGSSSEILHSLHYLHASTLEDNERRAREEAYTQVEQQRQKDRRRNMNLFTLIVGQLTSSTAQQAPLWTPPPPETA